MTAPIPGKLNRDQMAWRVAQAIPGGSYVNLGIGMPEMVANHLAADSQVIFHCENGRWGTGGRAMFNMDPHAAIDRLAGQYEPVTAS